MTNKDIDKYLNGQMNPQSEKEFERKLKEDKQLKKEFELHKEINYAIQEDEIIELRDKLEDCSSGKSKRKIRLNRTDLLSIAASLTLFLAVGLLMLFHNQLTDPDDLYASYFEPYPSIYSQRSVGGNTSLGKIKEKAFLTYEKENWRDSKSYFSELLEKHPGNIEYTFYLGVLNLKLDKTNKALEQFQGILQKDDPLFEGQANWYLALSYLKNGDIEESAYYLDRIIREDMANKEKASELIKKLK